MRGNLQTTKRLLTAACCIFGLFFTVAHARPAAKKSHLYVLWSRAGVIQHSHKGYTLTLEGAGPEMLWFVDRPYRKAGYMHTRDFISHWSTMFRNNPPNAGLVHLTHDPKYSNDKNISEAVAIELMQPRESKGKLIFNIKREVPGLHDGTLRHVALFIDMVF